MIRVFLDIETIPTTSPEEMARLADEVLAHNRALKKPHDADEVKRLVDEKHRATALDASLGEIVCIAAAVDDGPVCSWSRDWREGGSEADLLRRFRDDLRVATGGAAGVVVGHNAVDFDRPFLFQRSIVCAVPLPSWLTDTVKPWEAMSVDTMLLWTQGRPRQKIALDRLCRSLGLPTKSGDITGATVWDAVLAGRTDDVAAYCARDVDMARRAFHRIRKVLSAEVPA